MAMLVLTGASIWAGGGLTRELPKACRAFLSEPLPKAAIAANHYQLTPGTQADHYQQAKVAKVAALAQEAGKVSPDAFLVGDSLVDQWRWWSAEFPLAKSFNAGIGGDVTDGILWRIQNGELPKGAPGLIVLAAGSNNVSRKDPAEAIAAGVVKLIDVLRRAFPSAKIVVLSLLPLGAVDDPSRPLRLAVNGLLAKCTNGDDLFFLDLWKSFSDPSGAVRTKLMQDPWHPNKDGYAIIAAAIRDIMKGNLAFR